MARRSPALSDEGRLMFQLMVLFAVGRLAALNLGSHDAAGAGRSQSAITPRRIVRALPMLLGLAAVVFGAAPTSNWLNKLPASTITNIARGAFWAAIVIAVGVVLAVGLGLLRYGLFIRRFISLHPRVLDVMKEKTEESANAWLAIIDGGNYAQSWAVGGGVFSAPHQQRGMGGAVGESPASAGQNPVPQIEFRDACRLRQALGSEVRHVVRRPVGGNGNGDARRAAARRVEGHRLSHQTGGSWRRAIRTPRPTSQHAQDAGGDDRQ